MMKSCGRWRKRKAFAPPRLAQGASPAQAKRQRPGVEIIDAGALGT
jgi:hypothetical protein